jgi:hypothetical protein
VHIASGGTTRIFIPGLLLSVTIGWFATVHAQEAPGLLEIQILPPGTAVELLGPQNTLTASPNAIVRPQAGWYKLKASCRGFEDFKQTLYIDAQSPTSISGTLSAKSRWKAGARSVFIPGWGHYYSNRTARGVVFTLATVGMAVGYYFFDAHADNRLEQYEDLREDYDEAGSVAEQEALLPAVEEALNDAYNADRNRVAWGYLTVGVWAYQIIDAVVFFPAPPEVRMGPVQMGLLAPNEQALVRIGATCEF